MEARVNGAINIISLLIYFSTHETNRFIDGNAIILHGSEENKISGTVLHVYGLEPSIELTTEILTFLQDNGINLSNVDFWWNNWKYEDCDPIFFMERNDISGIVIERCMDNITISSICEAL